MKMEMEWVKQNHERKEKKKGIYQRETKKDETFNDATFMQSYMTVFEK